MVRKRRHKWTTISLPIHVKEDLEDYGRKSESWGDLFIRLMKDVEDYNRMKQRYFKK